MSGLAMTQKPDPETKDSIEGVGLKVTAVNPHSGTTDPSSSRAILTTNGPNGSENPSNMSTVYAALQKQVERTDKVLDLFQNQAKYLQHHGESIILAIPEHVLEKERKKKLTTKKKKRRQAKKTVKRWNEKDAAKLSVEAIKDEFIQKVRSHQVVIVDGVPGSGKSTRLPQYLYHDGIKGKIVCTEPRRMAAKALAVRVAEEMETELGQLVGYQVRFESKLSEKTAVKYVTEGVLLRDMEDNATLEGYGAVILDDVHGRTLAADLLMGLLKSMLPKRPDLKIIITSATLETEKFQKYFSTDGQGTDIPIVKVPEQTPFPVKIVYKEDETTFDYVEAAVGTAMKVHRDAPKGDILIFLTGEDDILQCCDGLAEMDKKQELWVLPCYSALPLEDIGLVFEDPPPKYKRKVVVATNIAEVSITIDGIVYVIDAGLVKQSAYNCQSNMKALNVCDITKVQATQRAGRVGRTQPGVVYRLYSKRVFKKFKKNRQPEIQHSNLESTILTLAAHNQRDPTNFNYMDAPKKDSLERAIDSLKQLGALDANGELTDVGQKMVKFPIEPKLAKTLLTSIDLGCSNEVLTVASVISANSSGKKVFYKLHRTLETAKVSDSVKQAGDHVAFVAAFNHVKRFGNRSWCYWNHVNYFGFQEALAIRSQLKRILESITSSPSPTPKNPKRSGFPANIHNIQKSILSGYFANIAVKHVQEKGKGYSYKRYPNKKKNHVSFISNTSVLQTELPELVIYDEVFMPGGTQYMVKVTPIKEQWLQEYVPEFWGKFKLAFPVTNK